MQRSYLLSSRCSRSEPTRSVYRATCGRNSKIKQQFLARLLIGEWGQSPLYYFLHYRAWAKNKVADVVRIED
ncbi:MAG: hypothetical protein BRC33_03755 [Cyanobacteria bacterium SW_9_44_58]|nr:MAG: hypothetical protein BRC33_03755 [Cyanobacteria bacterium SW_9_44_58]